MCSAMLITAVLAEKYDSAESKIRQDIAQMLENYDYSAVIAESVKESSPAPLTVEQLLAQLQQSLTTQEQFAEAETMNFKFDLQTGEIVAEAKDLEGNLVYTKTYEAA